MSIILATEDGRTRQINVWNWGTLHHRVAVARLFPDEVWAPKRHNDGGDLDPDQVVRLADFLEAVLLPQLQDGERMFVNGTVTATPDDGTLYRDEADLWKNYSLRRDVLVRIIAFLRDAPGPVSVR